MYLLVLDGLLDVLLGGGLHSASAFYFSQVSPRLGGVIGCYISIEWSRNNEPKQ